MLHRVLPVGPLQCNCTILACEKTKEAILVDPGDEAPRILEELTKLGVKVNYILHTHAHFDHVGATKEVRAQIDSPVCLHRGDEFLYDNLPMQGKLFGMPMETPPRVERFVEDNEILKFGENKVEVIHTPGHSPGGICLKVSGDGDLLLSGDTLFHRSIGRTDLWGGETPLLLKSIKQRLFTLGDDLPVFPGHGPQTRIGEERRENPFLI